MVVSTASSITIEEISEHAAKHIKASGLPDPGRWLQLYG
jgi:hypothetical protein